MSLFARLPERTRWAVASAVNKIPGMCWTSLVCWVLFDRSVTQLRIDDSCRRDAEHCGVCYCGKFGPEREAMIREGRLKR